MWRLLTPSQCQPNASVFYSMFETKTINHNLLHSRDAQGDRKRGWRDRVVWSILLRWVRKGQNIFSFLYEKRKCTCHFILLKKKKEEKKTVLFSTVFLYMGFRLLNHKTRRYYPPEYRLWWLQHGLNYGDLLLYLYTEMVEHIFVIFTPNTTRHGNDRPRAAERCDRAITRTNGFTTVKKIRWILLKISFISVVNFSLMKRLNSAFPH